MELITLTGGAVGPKRILPGEPVFQAKPIGVTNELESRHYSGSRCEFDPRLHEAVMTMETSEYPDQQIVEELQRGYFFKQRLLRPAMVKVAKHPTQPAEPAEGVAAEPPDTQPE